MTEDETISSDQTSVDHRRLVLGRVSSSSQLLLSLSLSREDLITLRREIIFLSGNDIRLICETDNVLFKCMFLEPRSIAKAFQKSTEMRDQNCDDPMFDTHASPPS